MNLLKLVEICPCISKIWVNFYRPQEPFSSFTDLTLCPKQPTKIYKLLKNGENFDHSIDVAGMSTPS